MTRRKMLTREITSNPNGPANIKRHQIRKTPRNNSANLPGRQLRMPDNKTPAPLQKMYIELIPIKTQEAYDTKSLPRRRTKNTRCRM